MRAIIHPLLLLVALLGFPLAHGAGNPPTPTDLPGGTVIDVPALEGLLAAEAPLIVDLRNPVNFGRGHLPDAQAVPYREISAPTTDFDAGLDTFDLAGLPERRDQVLVFYSHGVTGWKSYKAAVLAIRAGYTRVHWFRGGFEAWQAAGKPIER